LRMLLPVPEVLRSQADAYLTALIIFVAPVVALPEFLAKYRLHGANLFQTDQRRGAKDKIEHRLEMRSTLLTEIRRWIEGNVHDVASSDLRAYLTQWTKSQELDAFELHKPGHWKYFRHLLEYPRVYGEIMTSRHRLYSYIRASSALLLGYDHLHLLDSFRRGFRGLFSRPIRRTVPSEVRKEATAKG
jgi:hypothetical protein